MGLFGSNKPFTCWICGRKTDKEGALLLPEDLDEAFSGVFKEFNTDEEFVKKKICACEVCCGIMKLASSDSLQAKMKISAAANIASKKASSAVSAASSKVKGILNRK
ncbi:MAG: hypothetical protein ACW981_16395 [Candidatus Hodarchaeales archaeon]|jgi:hypothetical protein